MGCQLMSTFRKQFSNSTLHHCCIRFQVKKNVGLSFFTYHLSKHRPTLMHTLQVFPQTNINAHFAGVSTDQHSCTRCKCFHRPTLMHTFQVFPTLSFYVV